MTNRAIARAPDAIANWLGVKATIRRFVRIQECLPVLIDHEFHELIEFERPGGDPSEDLYRIAEYGESTGVDIPLPVTESRDVLRKLEPRECRPDIRIGPCMLNCDRHVTRTHLQKV